MSQETRKQRRLMRRAERKERKEAFAKFTEAVKAVLEMQLLPGMAYKDKFKQMWPVIKPTLEFAIVLKITGDKFDTAANKLIIIGDRMFGTTITDEEALEFLNELSVVWDTIEMVFEIVKIFVNDKVDEIIDKVIEIGEWMFEMPH